MSTYATLHQAYLDNLDYDIVESESKCQEFIKACRGLLSFPARVEKRGRDLGGRTEFDREQVERQLNTAIDWLRYCNASGAYGSVDCDFSEYRQ